MPTLPTADFSGGGKVGILTFHEVFNPGAFLQMYATYAHLRARGHEVEVINYVTPGFEFRPWRWLWKLKGRIRSNYLTWGDAVARDLAYRSARRKHLRLSGPLVCPEELKRRHYQTVVVGRDIVWDYNYRNDPT